MCVCVCVCRYVAPHAPHSPSDPAPWYADSFPFARAERTASYGVQAPCHHWAVAVMPTLNLVESLDIDRLARRRLQVRLRVVVFGVNSRQPSAFLVYLLSTIYLPIYLSIYLAISLSA